jgi:hypothetical protein
VGASLGEGGAGKEGSKHFSSPKYAISDNMEQWTAEGRGFRRFSTHASDVS